MKFELDEKLKENKQEDEQLKNQLNEKNKKIIEINKPVQNLSGLQTPLAIAENQYNSVLRSLTVLDREENEEEFQTNYEILKEYLVKLGYGEDNKDLKKVLQKNSNFNELEKIILERRIQLFNTLDFNATRIRTDLVFADFAQKLTALLEGKHFAPVNAPNFNEIFSDPNAIFKLQENTKQLIDFIIVDWESIKNKKINLNNSNDLKVLLGKNEEGLALIETLIFPLKNISLAEFSTRIDLPEKRAELLTLLGQLADYLDWLKTEFVTREKAVNKELYLKDQNLQFAENYNKKVSIKTMHDYLDRIAVASRRYTKAIDFIFQKIGRLTPEECINGGNFYIEAVRPVREIGGLLSVIGFLNMGLSLGRGILNGGMKQSALELQTYFKNKQLKLAAKYVGASFNKKHLFGLLLPVGIGVAYYGHSKTDTLRQKRDRFKSVITELEKPYQKEVA